jgi:hypothetical protein
MTLLAIPATVAVVAAVAFTAGHHHHKRCLHPWQASSVTGTMVDGHIVQSKPTVTKGCN